MVFLTARRCSSSRRRSDRSTRRSSRSPPTQVCGPVRCAALRWERVDLSGPRSTWWSPTPRFTASSSSARRRRTQRRTVRLPRFLADLLGEHQALTGPTGLVFRDSQGGPVRHSNFYRRTFKPAVERGGRQGHDPEGSPLPRPAPHLRCPARRSGSAPDGDQGTARALARSRSRSTSTGTCMPAIDEALAEGLDGTYREAVRGLFADSPRTRAGHRASDDRLLGR